MLLAPPPLEVLLEPTQRSSSPIARRRGTLERTPPSAVLSDVRPLSAPPTMEIHLRPLKDDELEETLPELSSRSVVPSLVSTPPNILAPTLKPLLALPRRGATSGKAQPLLLLSLEARRPLEQVTFVPPVLTDPWHPPHGLQRIKSGEVVAKTTSGTVMSKTLRGPSIRFVRT